MFTCCGADISDRCVQGVLPEVIERELRREDLPPATFGNLRSQELILAKTADRAMRERYSARGDSTSRDLRGCDHPTEYAPSAYSSG